MYDSSKGSKLFILPCTIVIDTIVTLLPALVFTLLVLFFFLSFSRLEIERG